MKLLLVMILATAVSAVAERPKRPVPAYSKSKAASVKPHAAGINPTVVNDPGAPLPTANGSSALRAQILLDRAGFSSGEIDGTLGTNTSRALKAFQQSHSLPATGRMDRAAWTALNTDASPALVPYTIGAEDVKGPFVEIPADMMEKSKLEHLGYTSALEGLAEKFHCSPQVLKALNPQATFETAGEELLVPGIRDQRTARAAKVVVSKSESTVSAFDARGKLIAQYPASIGSQHDPLPVGQWKITGVARQPVFHYNPDLFWDASTEHSKALIPAGPNNPVGVVWIDLSKPHYGIHGTPEPGHVGHTQSHGCIRLTNWDALELAGMVTKGIPAILKE
ncbi:MAG TPA: L,D-transpeptidase [Bryobacteraceae bacterium]|jgi:lipoprotein-anchoring transpeptidase ErfK/SrfK|nr:L,D-transpeptidase [Bryobacteraceae bacterium]